MDLGRYCFYKNFRVDRKAERPGGHPLLRRHHRHHQGHRADQPATSTPWAQQIIATNPMFRPGDRMLAAMPLFHGFGLGVCVHSMLASGGRCILIPRFTAKSYAKQIVKYKCNFIAGVPTLYEALLRLPSMDNADLSSLKGVFSGGDSLSIELKKKFDKFLLRPPRASSRCGRATAPPRRVTACCLTPTNMYKEGSIGLPFPDTYYQDREARHRRGGALRRGGRDPAWPDPR